MARGLETEATGRSCDLALPRVSPQPHPQRARLMPLVPFLGVLNLPFALAPSLEDGTIVTSLSPPPDSLPLDACPHLSSPPRPHFRHRCPKETSSFTCLRGFRGPVSLQRHLHQSQNHHSENLNSLGAHQLPALACTQPEPSSATVHPGSLLLVLAEMPLPAGSPPGPSRDPSWIPPVPATPFCFCPQAGRRLAGHGATAWPVTVFGE